MSVFGVCVIGIALAMDAFGISIGIGVNSIITRKKKIGYILSFGFFQFLFTLIGGGLGYYFDTYILPIPSALGGIIVGAIGILMIIDGVKEKENSLLVKNSMVIILGISVSIDALIIGFTTFHQVGSLAILLIDSILIGLITLFFCTFAFFSCRYLRKISFISKYANFLGGIALISFAIKMIFF